MRSKTNPRVAGVELSTPKMREASSDHLTSSVAMRQEKVPVWLRRWPSARSASLRFSAASACARSMAMLAMCVTWPMSSCWRVEGVPGGAGIRRRSRARVPAASKSGAPDGSEPVGEHVVAVRGMLAIAGRSRCLRRSPASSAWPQSAGGDVATHGQALRPARCSSRATKEQRRRGRSGRSNQSDRRRRRRRAPPLQRSCTRR